EGARVREGARLADQVPARIEEHARGRAHPARVAREDHEPAGARADDARVAVVLDRHERRTEKRRAARVGGEEEELAAIVLHDEVEDTDAILEGAGPGADHARARIDDGLDLSGA